MFKINSSLGSTGFRVFVKSAKNVYGNSIRFLLDTGATVSMVTTELLKDLIPDSCYEIDKLAEDNYGVYPASSVIHEDDVKGRHVVLKNIEIGGVLFKEFHCFLVNSESLSALIGLDFITAFRSSIDYKSKFELYDFSERVYSSNVKLFYKKESVKEFNCLVSDTEQSSGIQELDDLFNGSWNDAKR